MVLSYLVSTSVALVISPIVIRVLKRLKTGQNILEYVDNHMQKQGTLSMGGLIFILSMCISFLFFSGSSVLATLVIVITFCYGLLGFLDDFLKIRGGHNEGLKPYQKIVGQVGISIIVSVFIYNFGILGDKLIIPFSHYLLSLSFWIIPFVIIYFIAVTNSVNLTDGLDGLAGSVSMIVILDYAVISYIRHLAVANTNNMIYSEYLNLAIVCIVMAGALSVFLLYNRYPAKIFMGDTGSLALGGFLASVSAFLQEYLLFAMLGIMFVVSAVSDILQVGYYKITRRRIFKMAPFHHHLERSGWHENRVVGLYIFVTSIVSIIVIAQYIQHYLSL